MNLPKTANGKRKLIVSSEEAILNKHLQLLGEWVPDMRQDQHDILTTVSHFIQRFPVITQNKKGNEVFEHISTIEVPKALNDYYQILRRSIKRFLFEKEKAKLTEEKQNITVNGRQKEKSKKEKELEKEIEKVKLNEIEKEVNGETEKVFVEIMNYILTKIYYKVFPKENDDQDLYIYQQCLLLSWIEPCHLGINAKVNVEQFLPITIGLVQQLDDTKTPYGKMEIFTKVLEKILSTLNLCLGPIEGGVDDTLPPLLFVIIKSKPKRFSSNLKYIHLFHNQISKGRNSQRFALLNTIKERLSKFSSRHLTNMSEEEYIKNCTMVYNKDMDSYC